MKTQKFLLSMLLVIIVCVAATEKTENFNELKKEAVEPYALALEDNLFHTDAFKGVPGYEVENQSELEIEISEITTIESFKYLTNSSMWALFLSAAIYRLLTFTVWRNTRKFMVIGMVLIPLTAATIWMAMCPPLLNLSLVISVVIPVAIATTILFIVKEKDDTYRNKVEQKLRRFYGQNHHQYTTL